MYTRICLDKDLNSAQKKCFKLGPHQIESQNFLMLVLQEVFIGILISNVK